MKKVNMSCKSDRVKHESDVSGKAKSGLWGETWIAKTDAGTPVHVFIPKGDHPERKRYFCHGLALGTYERYGYTVFSGVYMYRVLRDEWEKLSYDANVRPGDICVWWDKDQPMHSALVKTAHNNRLNIELRTKNGAEEEQVSSLKRVDLTYKSHPNNCVDYHFYRRRRPIVDSPRDRIPRDKWCVIL